jgi:HK97 family phage major capsid protein
MMTDLTPITTALAELKTAAGKFTETRSAVTGLENRFDEMENRIEYAISKADRAATNRAVQPADQTIERRAVSDFVRTGRMELETRGLDATTNANGAVTLPKMMADQIVRAVFDMSPMARLARRVYIEEGSAFDQPIVTTLPGAEWVTDTGARSTQASPTFALATIPLQEISTLVPVTQRIIDDSHYDISGMLESVVVEKFGQASGKAIISGVGTTDPKGLLTYTTASTADATRAWFTTQHVATGAAGAFGASPVDNLIDLVYTLKAGHRQNATWLMNRRTAAQVRKVKDSTGQPIWTDGLAVGQPSALLGFPVELDEEMPDIAANSLSVAFGDFAAAYTVVGRTDMMMLRDPYSLKGSVMFYATMRIGGGLVNSEAVKFLKFATT